jgi:four helix bundle protein
MEKLNSKYHFKFEDLIVYQKAIVFGEYVNKLIQKFPKHETYKLSSQFGNAADSIALNIAEGTSGSYAIFNRYLVIAKGSANECVACSTKAFLRGYITTDEKEEVRKQLSSISKMIFSLIKSNKK